MPICILNYEVPSCHGSKLTPSAEKETKRQTERHTSVYTIEVITYLTQGMINS